jgi:hypothetical protein
MGDDRPGRADELHFPGIAPELAEALAQRGVKAVGIDTASIDHGPSKDFRTHQILMGGNLRLAISGRLAGAAVLGLAASRDPGLAGLWAVAAADALLGLAHLGLWWPLRT